MGEKEQYLALMSEVIAKQSDILGPDIAKLKARNVSSIVINNKGEVTDVKGDPSEALQRLIDEYIALSGLIVKNVMKPIFEKYPSIKLGE
ncbi:MAG: hypothetical protein Q7S48_02940 [bacterium]|nr:hypothetical protein [bacterium]